MNTIKRDSFFLNGNDRIFTVRLAWDIGQPFVCGKLKEVVEYSLQPNNGIMYFAEITNSKLRKLSKKELKELLSYEPLKDLSIQLFKKF